MRRLALVPLLALTALPAAALEPLMPPHVTAEMFCLGRTSGDMSLIESYLTDELSYAIEKAMAQNAAIQKARPDEKPPLGDGVPWSSFQDAVPECTVDYEAAKATPAAIPVSFSVPDAPDAGWTDTLLLRDVDGNWKLDDIRYEDGGSLSELLAGAFD